MCVQVEARGQYQVSSSIAPHLTFWVGLSLSPNLESPFSASQAWASRCVQPLPAFTQVPGMELGSSCAQRALYWQSRSPQPGPSFKVTVVSFRAILASGSLSSLPAILPGKLILFETEEKRKNHLRIKLVECRCFLGKMTRIWRVGFTLLMRWVKRAILKSYFRISFEYDVHILEIKEFYFDEKLKYEGIQKKHR